MELASSNRVSEGSEGQGESWVNLALREISDITKTSKNEALVVLENINIYNSANKVLWRSFEYDWETLIVDKVGGSIVLTWSYFDKFRFDKVIFDDKWYSRQLSTQAIIDIFDLFCIK